MSSYSGMVIFSNGGGVEVPVRGGVPEMTIRTTPLDCKKTPYLLYDTIQM